METGNVDQIFEEIRQLRIQYDAEVGRPQKSWPNSIRDRTVALARLGLRSKVIAERSGISSNTIYSWMTRSESKADAESPKPGSFISVPVTTTKSLPEPIAKRRYRVRVKPPTVTVKIGDRIEISGLTAAEALRFARTLGL